MQAKADLGYEPLTSTSDGLQIMLQAFKFLRNDEAMRKYKIVAKPKGPFTLEEVAVHNKPDDVWVIIDGKVYDITAFVDEHPGGPDNILQNAGGDATYVRNVHMMLLWSACQVSCRSSCAACLSIVFGGETARASRDRSTHRPCGMSSLASTLATSSSSVILNFPPLQCFLHNQTLV